MVDELLPRAREIGDVQVVGLALWANALLENAQGRTAAAMPLLQEAAKIAARERTWLSVFMPDAMRILVSSGRVQEATELFGSLLSFDNLFAARDLNAKESAAALLAEAAGKTDDAVELFRAAARGWHDYGSVVEEAHALLGVGRCLIALGRPDEAGSGHRLWSRRDAPDPRGGRTSGARVRSVLNLSSRPDPQETKSSQS
jgi:tetratricopeptide (TPR) repeat protein